MLPHSYAVDSLSKSQDLAATVTSAQSPPQIAAACASIETFLRSHSPDHARHFFSLAFPSLISKLFGFGLDDAVSSPQLPSFSGWIDVVSASNDVVLAQKLFELLAPGGALLGSIAAVDRLELVKYVFPNERLPEWARLVLSSEKDCKVLSHLCSIFENRVVADSVKSSVCQVQLNVFEYYMFWFAYYPVCRGNSENSGNGIVKTNPRFKLEKWVSSFSGFSGGLRPSSEQKVECNLYIRLLYAYLRAFVPASAVNVNQPYRSSLLHYSHDGSATMQADFVVTALIQFWLLENDFSPLPSDLLKSFGVNTPFRLLLGETPPTAGLGEVVKLLVKYLNLSSVISGDGSESVDYGGSPICRTPSSRSFVSESPLKHSVGPWNVLIQRPLYRFILRTFLFCPIGTSIKNAYEVFSVWITYIEPWAISLDDVFDLGTLDGSAKVARKEDLAFQDCVYSPCWQGFVLSNYLYYSSLVMHFIGFAHKFLHADVELVVQMVLKVMSILTSSKELVDLLRTVDSLFSSNQAGSSKPMLNSLYRYAPLIRGQLKDWEEGLSESDADGSFLHENWNKDLRLFSNEEDGGQQLLQLFILRAEAELQAIASDNLAQNLQSIDSLKSQVSCLFGSDMARRLTFSPEPKQNPRPRADIFNPRTVNTLDSVKTYYKGDWMKRPISDDEVAWLAKLFVSLSDWLNENIGINHPENGQVGPTWSYVEVSGADVDDVVGPRDTVKAMLHVLVSWCVVLGTAVVRLMRKHGLRVNLRVLASKKVVMAVLLYVVFNLVMKVLGVFLKV